jgi:hypothetical protein
MLDQMGIPHEGYPEAHHGRFMRSGKNRSAEQQRMGMRGRGSGGSVTGSGARSGRGRGRRGG